MERPFIVSLKQIGGEIARWACRQSPYGMPENLDLVLTQFYQRAANDFTVAVVSPWDRWREFTSREQLEWYIGDRLIGTGFEAWNRPKVDNGAPFAFVSRYGGPPPDHDFIDIFAFLRNVAIGLCRGVEQEREPAAAKSGN